MIQEITEMNFPAGVTLSTATVSFADMGERIISADVRINGGASVGDNSYLVFRGEKFVPVVKDPQALKNNERTAHVVSVNFQSFVIAQLKRYWFFKAPEVLSDVAVDTYVCPIGLNLESFVTLFNKVLSYYYGNSIVMEKGEDVNYGDHAEAVFFDINYTSVWDVLAQVYEKYGVRWRISLSGDIYTITLTNSADTIQHSFSYGYNGGLTHMERQVQNEDIRNVIFGRGVDTNLPHYYFKRVPAGDQSGYASDPDALYELKDIAFDALRDATFRWYVRGWMQNSNRKRTWEYVYDPEKLPSDPEQGDPNFPYGNYFYPSYQESDIPASPAELHDSCLYAFRAGKTDSAFNPVEYIRDSESISRYGELWGKAEPDESIYPSVKVPIVGYENNTPDAVSEATKKEARQDTINDAIRNVLVWLSQYSTTKDLDLSSVSRGRKKVYTGVIDPSKNEASNGFCSEPFVVEEGMSCSPVFNIEVQFGYLRQDGSIYTWVNQQAMAEAAGYSLSLNEDDTYYYAKNPQTGAYLIDEQTGEPKVNPLIIPSGEWMLEFHVSATQITPPIDELKMFPLWRFRFRVWDIKLNMAVQGSSPYRLFNVWLGNVWNTEKDPAETAEDYAIRVWTPILGTKEAASIYFASGALSRSSDYDFLVASPLLRGVSYDTSKDGSHWKLTLVKSQAEYQADGKFIPRVGIEPSVGDIIGFSNDTIVYPQSTIIGAEEQINAHKQKVLADSKDIQPVWAVKLDKVRINTLSTGEISTLYSRLDVGRKVYIYSNTLIPDGDHTRHLYISAMTITWSDDTVANPDVDITLSQEVRVYHSPIQSMQSQIREVEIVKVDAEQAEQVSKDVAIQNSIPSIKPSRSASRAAAPLELANTLQSPDYSTGLLEGTGWSIYRDTFGNCILEADKIIARQGVSAPSIEIDEWKHLGGVQILSAASMRISSVETINGGLRCFFDSKNGSVVNMFHEHDFVLCSRLDEVTGEAKSYRYEVAAVGETFVELSAANHIGDVAAEGDEIIQFGNATDSSRQHAIIIDAASGHERMLFGLNSVDSVGDVYYYAGAILSNGTERRRWFVGDRDGSRENFIEYAWNEQTQSYTLVVGGDVYVGGGNVSIDALNYLAGALKDNNNQGLILSNQIAVYTGSGAQAQVMGGINGAANAENIAAWFGGVMTAEGQTAAKVVFKFDGSGYVAAKHISWDAAGNCTIDGSVQLAAGGTVGDLLTLVQGAIQKSQVAGKGSRSLPVYFDANGNAQTITDVAVSGGVSANGYADMGIVPNGGGGAVAAVEFDPNVPYNEHTAYSPSSQGLITLPAYPSLAGLASEAWVQSHFAAKGYEARVQTIEGLIPAQATSSNQLADKAFVNSSIATATAAYQGSYNLVSDLSLTTSATRAQIATALASAISGEDNNDYAFVEIPTSDSTPTQIARVERYKYNGSAWGYEYTLNNSGMTAAQWAAVNSGITASKVSAYDAHVASTSNPHNVTKAQVGLGNVENTALSTWVGTTNINTLGTVTTGVWHGTAIADTYIASASAWNAKYDKPSGGIPKTDLAQGVQDSLGLADTALQSHQTIYNLIIKKNGTQVGSTYNPATAAQTIDITDVASANALSGVATRVGDLEGYFSNGIANNAARLSNTAKIGDTNKPVYFTANGVPAAISYTIGRNVAANEDVTAYTAGSYINVSNHVISAKEASASQGGVVTTGTQTFAGNKTLQGNFQATGGVAADGYADLSIGGNGGGGSVSALRINSGTAFTPDANGLISLTASEGSVNGAFVLGGESIPIHGLQALAYKSSILIGDHYSPVADASSQLSASASGATAAWSIDVVKGVQVQRDSKGHVVDITVTSGKIPAKPTYAFSNLTSHPTTLGGYGITDAKIENGVITLGSNTITPITSLPTFYNLAFQNASGTTVDTYKPTTSPSKTIKAGSNVTISAASNVITIAATDTKVTQTVTNSSNTSWRPLIVGYSWNDAETFAPSTTTNEVMASHLAKFAPSRGLLAIVGLRQMGTDAQLVAGSTNKVFNTNGGVSMLYDWAQASSKPSYAFSEITGTVTNAQLAGSIANSKLASAGKFTIGSTAIELGTTYTAANFRSYLGLGGAATYGATSSVTDGGTSLVTSGGVYSYVNALLTAAMKIEGETTTAISDGSTTNPVVIGGQSVSAYKGMVVFYGSKEFVWVGTNWKELGDESSFALKTTTVSGTGYLTGGGALSSNQTIDIESSVKTKIDNGATAYGWGNHANAGYALAANLGTASTHAHGDYVTNITYDSTNRKLQQSKGGGTATDIVTFGSNAFNSTAYLPLSGGTMTGAMTGTTIYSDTLQPRNLFINHPSDTFGASAVRGCITYNTSGIPDTCATPASRGLGIYITASATADYSRLVLTALNGIYLDGTVKINNNTAWHAGNDGSGSGLDADLLDGYHATGLIRRNVITVGTSSTHKSYNANDYTDADTLYESSGDVNPSYTDAWTNFPTTFAPYGGFFLLSIKEGVYKKQIYGHYDNNHLWVRNTHYSQGVLVWSDWARLALTTDNVESATKLQTARTLWGQSFNGTANVSGNMSNVGNIAFAASGKNIGGIAYFDTTNARLGIGMPNPTHKLHVNGDICGEGGVSANGYADLSIGGGSGAGSVAAISVGGTAYTPDASALVTIPVSGTGNTLQWGAATKIADIGGLALNVTMPADPNKYVTDSDANKSSFALRLDKSTPYYTHYINSMSSITSLALTIPSSTVAGVRHYMLIYNQSYANLTVNLPSGCYASSSSLVVPAQKLIELSYVKNGNGLNIITWSDVLQHN